MSEHPPPAQAAPRPAAPGARAAHRRAAARRPDRRATALYGGVSALRPSGAPTSPDRRARGAVAIGTPSVRETMATRCAAACGL